MANNNETSMETIMKRCLDTFFPDESAQKEMIRFMEGFFDSIDIEKIKQLCSLCPCVEFNSKSK